MPKIVTLKDNNNDTVYPITPIDAVFTDTSVTLENMIDAKADTDLTNVVNGSVTTAKIANSAVTSDKIDWTTHTLSYKPGFYGNVVLKSLGNMRFLQGMFNGTFPTGQYTTVANLPEELNKTIISSEATGVGRSQGDTIATITIKEESTRTINIRPVGNADINWARFSIFWFVQ